MTKINLTKLRNMVKKLKEGEKFTVRLVPCKLSPVKTFGWCIFHDMEVSSNDFETIEKTINSFHYYNCNYETGTRVHYYLLEN